MSEKVNQESKELPQMPEKIRAWQTFQEQPKYPNDDGEISFIKVGQDYPVNKKYNYWCMECDHWIGSVDLWDYKVKVLYGDEHRHLYVQDIVSKNLNVNEEVKAGRATKLTLAEARALIEKLKAEGFLAVTLLPLNPTV